MHRTPGRKLVQSVLFTLLTLSAGLWFGASPARATCGDYLVGHAAHGTMPAKPTQPSVPATPAEKPCQGPQCSRGSLPPLLPVTTIAVSLEQWGCMDMTPAIPDLEQVIRHLEDGVPRLKRRGAAIYHPPRAI